MIWCLHFYNSLNYVIILLQECEKKLIFFCIFKAYIITTSRGNVHMKSYPSDHLLNDETKRKIIDRILSDVKMDRTSYMLILTNSIIKEKQILTTSGKEILNLPEHHLLREQLKNKYPDREFDSMYYK